MKENIEVGDLVRITCRVTQIHYDAQGYVTAKILNSRNSVWEKMDTLEKLSDSEAMLWKLENE
jgi:hypothetical protein